MSEEWREFRREANRPIRWGIVWSIVIVAVVLVVGAIIWGINVASSGVRGEGDAIIQRNSAENWLDAQARFEENYAEYEATIFKIDQAKTALEADPEDPLLKTNYSGTVNYCASLVADYNADARNYLREDFRAADLPDKIDVDTCEPSAIP